MLYCVLLYCMNSCCFVRVNSVLPTTVDGGLSFQGLEEEKLEKVKEDSKEEERMDDS